MDRSKYVLLTFLVVVTAFRLWYINQEFLDLAPDEAHYWEWSRVPALSYYSKGPLVAYIIYIFTALVGNTPFGVRLGAVVLSVGTTLITYRLTQEIFHNSHLALLAAVLSHIVPLYAVGALLMTIDPPFVFFWGWSLYWAYTALSRLEGWRWYLMGITLGFGFLSKYTMLFFLPSLLLYLFFSPQDRHWLRKRELYLGIGVGFLFFLPVILWNMQYDWVSLKHVLGQAKASKGINLRFSLWSFKTVLDFLGGQAGVLSPLLFLALVYSMVVTGYHGVKHQERSSLFLSAFFSPIFCTYLLLSLRQKVQANWPAAAYFTAFVATVAVLYMLFFPASLPRSSPSFSLRKTAARRFLLSIFTLLALSLSSLLTLLGHFPHLPAMVGLSLPAQMDPTSRLRGWKTLGEWVSQWRAKWPHDPLPFLVSDRYQIASELAFYTAGQPRTYCVNLNRRQNQYDIWGGLERLGGQDAFYVQSHGPILSKELQAVFRQCTLLSTLPIYYDEVKVRSFFLFYCTDFFGVPDKDRLLRY